MQLSVCFVLLQALAVVCSACNLYSFNPKDFPRLVCNQKGSLKRNLKFIRQYHAKDHATCALNCQRDFSCQGHSFNTKSKLCSTYPSQIAKSNFRANKNSNVIYDSLNCYDLDGNCPFENPSFETVTSGKSNTNGFYGVQDVRLLPWAFDITADPKSHSYVELVTPKSRPANVDPAPSGENFAFFNVANNTRLYLDQSYHLKPHTNYTISINYAIISFKAVEQQVFSDYHFAIYTQDPDSRNVAYYDLGVGGVNGTWHKLTHSFQTKQGYGVISIGFQAPTFETTRLATFGLDGIKLELAQ